MQEQLNSVQRRVLGVLMEKSLAQPDYYPMTLNAIVVSCNQKNNRSPLVEYDEGTVFDELETLRGLGLTGRVLAGPGARADRFKHECLTHYTWGNRQQAVMAELLLRGPQTGNELKTRCARLVTFESMDALKITLDSLQETAPPWIELLPRQPGQREARYAHRLYLPDEKPSSDAATASEATVETRTEPHGPQRSLADLWARMEELERRVTDLENR